MRLDQRVHLAGLQSDLTDYYLGADVFLMTSREDPLPNVVIESMYAGLPVIAFAEGGGTPETAGRGLRRRGALPGYGRHGCSNPSPAR